MVTPGVQGKPQKEEMVQVWTSVGQHIFSTMHIHAPYFLTCSGVPYESLSVSIP